MLWIPLIGLWLAAAAGREYELAGRIKPEVRASVSLHGTSSPFSAATLSDARGRFHFRKILPGAYTVSVFVPGRGEARQTVEVGPSEADPKGRITLTLQLAESQFLSAPLRSHAQVSARELSIPERAHREYAESQKKLSRRDVPGALRHLQHAVEIAPQFSDAWNNLGTIAYQTHDFVRAEEYFRKSLAANPAAFEPLVNLGGVLVTVGKLEEALKYNLHAVRSRPNDALANSQLGMTYFDMGDLNLSRKYLATAKQLDPAHFSHPQLLLAEIHLRRKDNLAAADEMEDFIKHHPDWPGALKLKAAITKLRN